jgi:OFA family oxalate/formate antiporter-like MFS transporter
MTLFFPGAFVFGFPGIMAGHWQDMFHVNKAQIGQLMFYILAGTGSAMYLAGRLRETVGSRQVVLAGSLACSLATFGVAHAQSIVHVYVWAFIEGFFCGFVYIPCLAEFQILFPRQKGLVTGISNLTFGGAAGVMSPVFAWCLVNNGYVSATYTAALLSLGIGTSAAFLVRFPKADLQHQPNAAKSMAVNYLSLNQTMHLKSFWYLWSVWALAGASGISMIVLSASFGQFKGYDVTQYVVILTSFNILNGLGRLVCGRLADIYSKRRIMMTVFLMAAVAYICLPFADHLYLISFFACFVGLAFGVLFTISAPLVSQVFGLENFGRIFGLVFTAYGFFAGFLGPWMSGWILDRTASNYMIVFWLFACFYLAASVLILKVRVYENDQ